MVWERRKLPDSLREEWDCSDVDILVAKWEVDYELGGSQQG